MVYTLGVYSRLLPFQKESTSGTGHPDQRLPSSPSHCFSPIPCLPRHPCFSIFTGPAGPCRSLPGHSPRPPICLPACCLCSFEHALSFAARLSPCLSLLLQWVSWPPSAIHRTFYHLTPGCLPRPIFRSNMHRPHSQTELIWTLMPHHHTQSDLAVFHSAWKSVLPFLILNFSPNPTLPKSLGKLLVILQNPSSITTLRNLPRLTQA